MPPRTNRAGAGRPVTGRQRRHDDGGDSHDERRLPGEGGQRRADAGADQRRRPVRISEARRKTQHRRLLAGAARGQLDEALEGQEHRRRQETGGPRAEGVTGQHAHERAAQRREHQEEAGGPTAPGPRPTRPPSQIARPGTASASGPTVLKMPTYGGMPCATCSPPYMNTPEVAVQRTRRTRASRRRRATPGRPGRVEHRRGTGRALGRRAGASAPGARAASSRTVRQVVAGEGRPHRPTVLPLREEWMWNM